MLKRYLMLAALAVVLAGCGSNVKMDPPIEGTTTSGGGGAGGSGDGSRVRPGELDPAQADAQGGPRGVARVILFDFDSYAVKPEYQGLIDQHGRFLQANRGRNVSLEGHADERGSREYNLALGQKRAEAVRRALTMTGASDVQLEAVSFGKEKPAVQGSTEEAYAQNRRVELRYR